MNENLKVTGFEGRGRWATGLVAGAVLVSASPAQAATTLEVDFSQIVRPVTHVASGSLYGVTENLPADVEGLIAPLKPNMFTNPAENVQQPHGDAFLVADRISSTSGRVTIRLADWLPGWPYNFPGMAQWLSKVDQSVARKKQAAVDNFYGYEIWNEPDGTWKNSMSFNDFWKQTYDELRKLDPDTPIIGPSYSYYRGTDLQSFLSFARDNDCLPDIVSWHELSGGDVTSHFEQYRAMEKQLGIEPRLISINEYSGPDHIDDEGQPGASAPLIAKFERLGVDSACLTFWDVPHPGRLGSLLASDTSKNGGWWFYKWYGDMSGDMVQTVPPAKNDVKTLDGFASLDTDQRVASVLFAGENDGTITVSMTGFDATGVFGDTIHAVVERTPWVNRSTVVSDTMVVAEDDLSIENDALEISVPNANAFDGYRIYLTSNEPPPIDSGSGGDGSGGATAASGGMDGTGSGGRIGSGGVTGLTGGASSSSGGSDGTTMSGGSPSSGGQSDGSEEDLGPDAAPGCSCRTGPKGTRGRSALHSVLFGLGLVVFWSRRRRRAARA